MNYIREINAFYHITEQEPLTSSAISLWFALMHINNKAMWRKTFTASGPVLRLKAGLTESSFKRARKKLQEKGYIAWESRSHNQAPMYSITSLSIETVEENNDLHETKATPDISGHQECRETIKPQTSMNWNRPSSTQVAEMNAIFQMESPASQPTTYPPMDSTNQESIHKENHVTSPITENTPSHFQNRLNDYAPPILTETGAPSSNHYKNHYVDQDADHHTDHSVNRQPGYLTDHDVNHHPDHLTNHPADQHPAPLVKQNKDKTKPNEKQITAVDAFRFYEENFGATSPFIAESLIDWTDDLGEELVCLAMKRALERGKATWSYVKGILQAWVNKGIHTVADAESEEIAFKNRRAKQYQAHDSEVVPEWFQELEQQPKTAPTAKVVDAKDEACILAETQAMLDTFVK